MIEVENTDVNIIRNLIPMRNNMPASAYGLKAISDWFPSDLDPHREVLLSLSVGFATASKFVEHPPLIG